MPPSFANETDIKILTESTLQISGVEDFQWSVNEPSIKPLSQMTDSGESLFLDSPPEIHPNPPEIAPSLSTQQIESMISRQVETHLAKMAQNLLPEIAEKVIKQEIHRLLLE